MPKGKHFALRFLESPIRVLLPLGLVLSACGVQPKPAAAPAPTPSEDDNFTYTVSVEVAADALREDVEALHNGSVVVWRPEAGFAVLGVEGDLSSLETAETNENAFTAPITARAAGAEGSGFGAWSGGFGAWSGGFPAWSGGFGAWSGGFGAWSGGFGAWSGGELTHTPMDNLDMWLQVGLPEAHFFLAPKLGEDVVVAVIDTGVDLEHPAFVNRFVDGYDFVDNDDNPDEVAGGDAYGHGTGVAGIILQVAPRAKIMPIRVLDDNGYGDTDDVAEAVDWAVRNGADVINLSLGSTEESIVLKTLVEFAAEQGVYLTSSAGNNGLKDKVTHPAARATAGGALGARLVSVGSVDLHDVKSEFSNYGSGLELLAPGESLFTTAPDERFAYWTGTSFAAPIAAGSVALALGEDLSTDYADDLAKQMGDFADEVKDIPGNDAFGSGLGNGRLNIAEFLRGLELVDYGDPFQIAPESAWDLNFAEESGDVKLRVRSLTGDYNHVNIDTDSIELRGDNDRKVEPDEISIGASYTDLIFEHKDKLLELFSDPNIKPGTVKTLSLSFAVVDAEVKNYPVSVTFSDKDELWVNYEGRFDVTPKDAWDLNFATEDGEVSLEISDSEGGYNYLHMSDNGSDFELLGENGRTLEPDRVEIKDGRTSLTFEHKNKLLELFSDTNIKPGTVKPLTLSFAIADAELRSYPVAVTFADDDKLWVNYAGAFEVAPPSAWDLNFAEDSSLTKIRVFDAEGGYNHRHLNKDNVKLRGDSGKTVRPKEVSISSGYIDLEFEKRKLLELFAETNIKPDSTRSFSLSIQLGDADVKTYTVGVRFTDEDELWVNYGGSFDVSAYTDWDYNFSYTDGDVKVRVYDAEGGYNHRHLNTDSVRLRGNNKEVAVDEVKVGSDHTELVFTQREHLFELLGDNPTPSNAYSLSLSFAIADEAVRSYGFTLTLVDSDRAWVNYDGTFYVDAPSLWDLKKHDGDYRDVTFRIYDAQGGYNHVHVNESSLKLKLNSKDFNEFSISVKDDYTEVKVAADDVKRLKEFLSPDSGTSTIDLTLRFSFAKANERDHGFTATVYK